MPGPTRAEVRESLEAQDPRCRGPREQRVNEVYFPLRRSRPALDGVAVTVAEALGEEPEDADEALELLKETDATTDEAISALLQGGHRREASLVDEWTRQGCGESLVELELSEPLDGFVHEAPCPGCGRTVQWRPPRVEGEA